MIEFRPLKGIGDSLYAIPIVVRLCKTYSKTVIPGPFKRISDGHGRLHPRSARTGAVLPYHRFGYNQKGNQENGCIILFFLGWKTSC